MCFPNPPPKLPSLSFYRKCLCLTFLSLVSTSVSFSCVSCLALVRSDIHADIYDKSVKALTTLFSVPLDAWPNFPSQRNGTHDFILCASCKILSATISARALTAPGQGTSNMQTFPVSYTNKLPTFSVSPFLLYSRVTYDAGGTYTFLSLTSPSRLDNLPSQQSALNLHSPSCGG